MTYEIPGGYGYIVSHRKYNEEAAYEKNGESSLTLSINIPCIVQPALVTLTFLSWDIRDCNKDFLEVNSEKFCDDVTVGMRNDLTPALKNGLLQLQLTFNSAGQGGMRGHGFLIRYKGKT